MARKTAGRPQATRRATKRSSTGIRPEIGAIALSAFAILTLVALLTDQGALLHWWRTSLVSLLGWGIVVVPLALAFGAAAVWHSPLRGRFVSPGLGVAIVFLALLGIAHVAAGQGGLVGSLIGGSLSAGLSPVGATIVLVAILVAGIVVAANRTLADLARPALERRPSLPSMPSLPKRGERPMSDEVRPAPESARTARPETAPARMAEEPAQLRINIPEERPKKTVVPARPATVEPEPAPEPVSSPIAGLPSAIVAAEGVLHAQMDREWVLPDIETLAEGDTGNAGGAPEIERRARVIEETLAHFNIAAKVVEVTPGPVVTRYELKPAPGVKLSRIEALNDDLALALAARTIRIEAPIPGKSVVGIEIPNMAVGLVALRDVAETAAFRDAGAKINLAIGSDVAGVPIVLDLAAMPHLLVAGQTGSGKSVLMTSILTSILLSKTPDQVRLLIGDMKRVDFAGFRDIPHLIVDVMTEPDKILNALYWVTGEMDRRYKLWARASARNIAQYNETRTGQDKVPYIVFVIDELADLMLQSPIQVEKQITRIAQLSRAVGIHLVLGTQRPSVDIITGLIKANFPARIAFATASAVDSRTILDMTGAEKLLGRGDMLVLRPDLANPIRAQGVYVSDKEIGELTAHWVRQAGRSYDRHASVVQGEDKLTRSRDGDGEDIDDDRYDEALEIVQRAGQASVSMLQRKMTIGFARAGRLIDIMERRGAIGPSVGPGKMREVYGAPPPRRGADEDQE
ncbi:MAG TPA: DNA translocase FtsK [Candidatus Limnocylindria bacterium]|nr:DNA translocase FtsK [Candidatus Limnocylindria bacterium]